MSRLGMIGQISLASGNLSNDALKEGIEVLNLFGGDNGPAWIAYLKKVRKAGLPDQPPAAKPSVLVPVNTIELGIVETHDPDSFYRERSGLWVSDEFRRLVVTKAKRLENLDPAALRSYDLAKNAYDREITPELGENYIFDESELCARIAQMISKQPNGEAGDLLVNGYANLFYVAGCVVNVLWDADYRKWNVYAWGLDDDTWVAGDRAFSSN